MEDLLFKLTSVLLLAGWLYVTLFVHRKALRATVLRAVRAENEALELLESRWLVRLDNGREVIAAASGCVQCQGDLRPGRVVKLLRDKRGYQVAATVWRRPAGECGARR